MNSICWQTQEMGGRARVRPRKPRKIYLAEHRESVPGLTQKALGQLLRPKVSDMTVSRWETGESIMSTEVLAAVAEVLEKHPEDLYYPPETQTPNALLRDQPASVVASAIKMIKGLRE